MRSIQAADPPTFSFRRTRTGLAVALLGLLLLGLAASAGAEPRKMSKGACGRITRQIAHYEDRVLPMAYDRGDRLWWRSIENQVNRLKNRRADLCPEWGAQRTALQKMADQAETAKRVLGKAAKLAAAYLTGGLAP